MKSRRPATPGPRDMVFYGALLAAIALLCYSCVYIAQREASAATRSVSVPCSANLASAVKNDSKSTATRFVLGSCTYQVSTTITPGPGDEIAGVPGSVRTRPVHGTYPTGLTSKIVAAGGLDTIMKPEGQFYMEWIECSGAHFTGSGGTGTCLAGGNMAPTSTIYASHLHHNEGAGMTSFPGIAKDVEADANGTSGSQGFIAAGIKGRDFYEVSGGYYHNNTGNGLWCDTGCQANSAHPGFWVHDAEASDNDGGGIRYENATTKALIENNHVWGNSKTKNRAGVSVRDGQNATVRNNVFAGSGYAHNQAPDNIAIRADSGGRHPIQNVVVSGNQLNGEKIKTCGGPVSCSGNSP